MRSHRAPLVGACRAQEAASRRRHEEEELRKRRQLEQQRAEEAHAVESDPRVKTWMELARWLRVRVCVLRVCVAVCVLLCIYV